MTAADGSCRHPKDRALVFHYLLEDYARSQPDKPFLMTREATLSYAGANAAANRLARGLSALGVQKSDRVLVMMPSGLDFALTWFALCKLGALMSPVNNAYLGAMLSHQAADTGAKLALVADEFLERWHLVCNELPDLAHVVVYPTIGRAAEAAWSLSGFDDLGTGDVSDPAPAVCYRDPMAVFYTSGTTGPSKGVLYSYAQAHATAARQAALCDPDDVFYMCLPMFHVGLSHLIGIGLIAGATVAICPKFSASLFWSDIRRFDARMTLLMSTMSAFLMAQPESAADRDNPLTKVIFAPTPPNVDAFCARFDVPDVATLYNMTEVSAPLSTGFGIANPKTCGRLRPGVSARVVDAYDEPVPPGEIGELVLRSDDPWEFNLGYWRQPEKTVEAWRNQWLHTGDLFSYDEDGNYYFRDRFKDAIRRRGENISSFEVEREVETHPAVLEAAAVAVPSPDGEDEVKVVAALRPGRELTPEALTAHLADRLPAYMVPRYLDLRSEELPKTSTGKIRKPELRAEGAAGAWDRNASTTLQPR